MQDLIRYALIFFGFMIVINLVGWLLPFLFPLLIILFVWDAYRKSKRVRDYQQNYQEYQEYQQPQSTYDTSGNIKQDVIDVEYTEEKVE